MSRAVKLTVSPGTVVADRFAIRRFIAEGGMGEVYAARDLILEEDIAIKFLSRRNIGDENVIRRFHREIQLARKVTHPNVCRLFDVYQTALEMPSASITVPITFVTMELLSGETLEDRLERGDPMGEDEALPIAVQMCQALTAAHEAGVIHRDFKSNNVMLDEAGRRIRVVVTDFGLARSILPSDPSRTPLTADQLILGTAEYMAPEQIKGEPVSHKSDLYALGVVLFEMLTGRKPYEAENPMQLLVKRVSEPPARPRDFRPELSETWESVIVDCLAESPDDRPASAQEIIERLGGVPFRPTPTPSSAGVPPPDPSADTVQRPRGRGTWLVPALLLLAVLAFWASRTQAPAPTGVFNPQRLTTAPGLELDAVFSPDGSRIAYSREQDDGSFALFIQDIEGDEPARRLDIGDRQAFEPDFSPDASRLVFSAGGGIWSVPADGGAPEMLIERGARPTFSPDGRSIAFQSTSSPLLSDTTAPAMPPSVLGLFDLASGETRLLTRVEEPPGGHAQPAWAPDGRHLVFTTTGRSIGELWAVDVEDGELIALLRDPADAYDPVVAADGRAVYFSFRSLEVKTLWRLEIEPQSFEPRGEPVEVAGLGLSSIRQPKISRNGRDLLFSAYATSSNLWRQPLDAQGAALGRPQAITAGNDRYNRPAFSPDGAMLAFDHWKLGVDIDIFTQETGGGRTTQITELDGKNSHASWMPDGGLAYSAIAPDGRRTLRRLPSPAAGGAAGAEAGAEAGGEAGGETLLELAGDADWAVVSPDGGSIAFHSGRGGQGLDVWIQDLRGAPAWRLTFHEQSAGFPVFSPDGSKVAYQVRVRTGSRAWIAPLDGGEPRLLVDEAGESWPYSFSPDGEKLLFAGRRGGVWNVFWVDVESGALRQVTDYSAATGYLRYPTWSPRGDLLVYEKAETTSDLFLVRDFLPGG